jgi:TetR/AcrR family fatty acid metabolism transcriptional regulator
MKRSNKKRDNILKAAMELFSKRPYHKVAMDDIAKRAKVAKGTLYYYFESKEALYASLLHEGLDKMLLKLKERFKEDDPLQNIRLFISELVSFFNENRHFFMVLQTEESKLFRKRLGHCYKKICTVRDILTSLIKEGMKRGYIREDLEPSLVTEAVMGMIKGPVLHSRIDPRVHTATVVSILTEGIKKG